MSTIAIFIIGAVVSILCVLFVIITLIEFKKLGKEAESRSAF